MKRRAFIRDTALGFGVAATTSWAHAGGVAAGTPAQPFRISLSQWAFESEIFGAGRDNYRWFRRMLEEDPDAVLQGSMETTDIVIKARELGVHGVDLVTSMIQGRRDDLAWMRAFRRKAADNDTRFVCLMADTPTKVGAGLAADRSRSIEDHKRWIEAAVELGCEHVRVNPYSDGSYLQQLDRCAESLHTLAGFAGDAGMRLTVENHGHPSSNGAWLNMLVEKVAHPNLGVFLDFGNFFMGGFNVQPRRWYDLKQGVLDLAPYTVGVSAKTRAFTPDGRETTIDYDWSMAQVLGQGFNGWVSAEYAGQELSNTEGAKQTIALLRRIQSQPG